MKVLPWKRMLKKVGLIIRSISMFGYTLCTFKFLMLLVCAIFGDISHQIIVVYFSIFIFVTRF